MSGALLGPEALRQVREVVRQVNSEYRLPAGPTAQNRQQARYMFVAKTTSTITARSNDTPGQGTAEIYRKGSTTLERVSTSDETIYSLWDSTRESDAYVLVEQDADGTWWAITDEVGTQPEPVYAGHTAVLSPVAAAATGTFRFQGNVSQSERADINTTDVQVRRKGVYAITFTGSGYGFDSSTFTDLEGTLSIEINRGVTAGTAITTVTQDFLVLNGPVLNDRSPFAICAMMGLQADEYIWFRHLFVESPSSTSPTWVGDGQMMLHRIDASSTVSVPFDP